MKYYSNSTGGFYDPEINQVIPYDALAISDDLHMALLAGQREGKVIVCNGGVPQLGMPPAKTVNEKIADIEAEYQKKLADLDASLLAVLWADGANEVANRQALSVKRQQLTADKTAAITNVFLNG